MLYWTTLLGPTVSGLQGFRGICDQKTKVAQEIQFFTHVVGDPHTNTDYSVACRYGMRRLLWVRREQSWPKEMMTREGRGKERERARRKEKEKRRSRPLRELCHFCSILIAQVDT